MKRRITPDNIKSLRPNEIFVFGSNEAGIHGAGAAKTALKWGAVMGEGYGAYGNTYAIPTKDRRIATLPVNKIQSYVGWFIRHAKTHPLQTFLVTEIGCGLAGYSPEDIAWMFHPCVKLPNVHLPIRFWIKLRAHTWTADGFCVYCHNVHRGDHNARSTCSDGYGCVRINL